MVVAKPTWGAATIRGGARPGDDIVPLQGQCQPLGGVDLAKKSITDDRKNLREEAEARFKRDPPPEASRRPTPELLHELQIHQIELEMQNEELRRNQVELEEAHVRHVDLYDFAPVGYATLDLGGIVTGANLTAAELLGIERKSLAGRPFARIVHPRDADRWHLFFSALVRTDEKRARRLELTKGDGSSFVAHLVCERRADAEAGSQVRIVLTDVTELAKVEQALHETKERLSYVIDGSSDGFWDWDISTGRVKFSRSAASILGRDLDELEPNVSTWDRLIHPDDADGARAALDAHLRGESGQFAIEHRVRHKDGRWIWILDRGKVVERGADGKPMRMAGTYTDITERKQAQEALLASEAKFRELFHAVPALLWTIGPDRSVTDCNRAWCEFTGMTREQSLGSGWMEALHPDDRASPSEALADALARGSLYRVEQRLRRHDGEYRWFLTQGTPVRDSTGEVIRWHGANVEISERKQAEDALRESESRYRDLYDSLPDGIVGSDAEGHILGSNRAFREMLGYTAEDLQGLTFPQITPERWHERELLDVLEHVRNRSTNWTFEKEYRRKDGSLVPVEIRSFIEYAGERPGNIWAIVRDITVRKQAEEALRKSETLLRAVTNSSPDAIFAKDREGRWTFANAAALRTVGRPSEEILGNSTEAREVIAHDRKVIESGVGQTFEEQVSVAAEVRTYLSSKAPLRDAEGRVVGIVGVAKDVTEMRRLEERLVVTARLAAMGTLVAGVAHEINNPLAAELSGQGLALEVAREARRQLQEGIPVDPAVKLREIDEVIDALEDAQEAGQRVAKIVRELALFARPTATRSTIRLGDAVDLGMRWLPTSMFASADVEVVDRGAPEVVAAGGQIAQVVSNLISNAVKATRPGTRGKVVVRTGTGNEGRAVLEVNDQGAGIAPELCPRVFDPFFTTRPVGEGRGSGLGLAVAHAIVTDHGGTITVESEVGKGSTFRVELPVAPAGA